VPPGAKCHFTPPTSAVTPNAAAAPISFDSMASTSGQMNIDFSRFIDPTPLAIHPQLPLETVMELFKKMGPRVILIEHRGKLIGLVTVKDCLKYQFKVEASENPREDSALAESQERLWEMMRRTSSWISWRIQTISGGRIKLGGERFHGTGQGLSTRDSMTAPEERGRIVDGTEEDGTGLELVDQAE
jgi:chloride channel 3/4/5